VKIGIVGFGAAAIGFINEIKNTDNDITILERSKDIFSSSISGIRSDGKIFISSSMGGDIDIPPTIQKNVVNFYIDKLSEGDKKNIKSGTSFNKKSKFFDKFYSKGFEPVNADFWHIGTDQLGSVLINIFDELSSKKNINFLFNKKVTDIIAKEDSTIDVMLDENEKMNFDYVVVAAGRSGHKLVKKIAVNYPDLVLSNNIVDIGIRYELPDHLVEELNEEMYEFKVRLKTKTGYKVRTFCNNPSGFVVEEEYDDFVTVNGHSNSKVFSDNTNFAVLCSTSFTHPFNDPFGYGSYISKLANILAGGRKVLLQTYSDFLESKRTKKLGRVKPTLDDKKLSLGDINLALPRRIGISLTEFIEKLGEVVPGIAYPDNLLYAIEVKFYSNKLNNEKFKNLKFIGDCSGHTRSIVYATSHGKMIGRKLL